MDLGRLAEGIGTGGLSEVYNSIKAKGPAGVGGPAADPSKLVRQPNGTFFDPTTGTSYADQTGQSPVAAPNQAQLTAGANANSQGFLGNVGADRAIQGQAIQGDQGLAASYNNTINNPGAQSVAMQQQAQGADSINRQQQGLASGAGGANAASAMRTAATNIAANQVGQNQQNALLRAHEVASAQQGLGQVYNNIGQQGSAMAGQDIGAGEGFSQQAMGGASGTQGAQQDVQKENLGLLGGAINGGAGVATKAFA